MWHDQVLPLRVRVDMGVMELKVYSTFPKASEVKSHYQMLLSYILGLSLRGSYSSAEG